MISLNGNQRRVAALAYRLWLAFGPRPPQIRRRRLLEVLRPAPAERMLELGPGAGYYTIAVARHLEPTGTLAVVDIDQDMLDTTVRRLSKRGLGGRIDARRADAASLPFEDASFDGAFLVAVLGEVEERRGALRELGRVLRDDGRLVVGEVRLDPMPSGRSSCAKRPSRRASAATRKSVGSVTSRALCGRGLGERVGVIRSAAWLRGRSAPDFADEAVPMIGRDVRASLTAGDRQSPPMPSSVRA
jgi:SAM-dependent methyltransferase